MALDAQLMVPIYIILGAVAAMIYSLRRIILLERRILSIDARILSVDKKMSQMLLKKKKK